MKQPTAIILMLVIALAGCTSVDNPIRLTVFAASSLTDAFMEIEMVYEEQNPDVDIVLNFAGSSTLATQLIEGAPADVFASANNNQINNVVEAGRINAEDVRIFAGNALTVIMPPDNPAGIESLLELANPGVQLVLAAPGVPVREYTNTMLDKMADTSTYGTQYRERVLQNIVSEEENVRLVVVKVQLGEADAGIVYTSDVTPGTQVITLPVPEEFNIEATYPIAPMNDTQHTQDFIQFVLCGEGQTILEKWGFSRAEEPIC